MMLADRLRPPSPLDLLGDAYKDWLHLNVLDPNAGAVGLVNLSLHGSPDASTSLAVGAVLLCDLDRGWHTHVEVESQRQVRKSPTSVSVAGMSLELDVTGDRVRAAADVPVVAAAVDAVAAAPPITVAPPTPFGSGWISWRALPRMIPVGSLRLGDRTVDLDGATAYHDHNWGRWYWGDDAGWEWGVLHGADAVAFVVARITDRAHSRGTPALWVVGDGAARLMHGPSVRIRFSGSHSGPLPRVPGAMAALHDGRARPRLPSAVVVEASDGYEEVRLEMDVAHACQIIAAEPTRPGWAFIHELVGRFRGVRRSGGVETRHEGLAVFEYVD